MSAVVDWLERRHLQLLLLAVGLTPLLYFWWSGNVDLNVYRTGGFAVLHHVSLYSEGFGQLVPWIALPFTYPPLAAVLFVPLHLLPMPLADLAMCVASTAALTATMLAVLHRLLGWNRRALAIGLLGAVFAFAFEPVRSTIGFGQINLILMGLVALDCLLPRTRWPRGVLVGLAAAIKLTPAVFIVYFLVRRQYREAAVAGMTFVGLALVGFALAPADSTKYWFGVLFDPDRIGGATYAYNQCFQAVLHRVMGDGTPRTLVWLGLVLASGVLAGLAAYRARAVGDDVRALLVIAVWGLLASPVSWSHHWVWIAPASLLLIKYARQSKWMLAATIVILADFVIGPHQYLNPEGRKWSLPEHLVGSGYVLLGAAFLVVQGLKSAARIRYTCRLRS
ncbi:glycosyltransferase 87 family protein [Kribbella monticola]|uniref:glycosyltransferase 87 family protein n=1 Tax=Kribbella monticola TaxID=2185285 RepID=UPI00130052EB|nr:glycosyltransferase 87 family protein [Kribbella monticola]